MATIAERKYANYTVRIGEDLQRHVTYEESAAGRLMRVHHRISRVPSRQEFVLRHFADATVEDRFDAESRIARIPVTFFNWEQAGVVYRKKAAAGYWFFYARAGRPVNDPLVQLELEMMIDLDAEARHDLVT